MRPLSAHWKIHPPGASGIYKEGLQCRKGGYRLGEKVYLRKRRSREAGGKQDQSQRRAKEGSLQGPEMRGREKTGRRPDFMEKRIYFTIKMGFQIPSEMFNVTCDWRRQEERNDKKRRKWKGEKEEFLDSLRRNVNFLPTASKKKGAHLATRRDEQPDGTMAEV